VSQVDPNTKITVNPNNYTSLTPGGV